MKAFTGHHLIHITPDLLKKVEDLAELGLNQRQISANLGINQNTFIRKRKLSSEFEDAWRKGLAKGIEKVTRGLQINALTPTEANPGGVLGAQTFYLKTKAGWSDTLTLEGNPDKPIFIAPLIQKGKLDAFSSASDNEAE